MNTRRIMVTLAVAVLLAPLMLSAQRPAGQRGRQVVKGIVKALDLTVEQRQQIGPVMQERQRALQSLRNDTSLSRQQRMEKAREINQSYNARVEQFLTADQKAKFDQWKSQRGKRQGQGPQNRPRRRNV